MHELLMLVKGCGWGAMLALLVGFVERSPLPDDTTKSSVARIFSRLSFPAPEGGIVTVTYPITFSPTRAR